MKKNAAVFAIAAMSASLLSGAIVIDDCWPDPNDEELAALSVYGSLDFGVAAHDDSDTPAELYYNWSLVAYPDDGDPEVYDLPEFEGSSEMSFDPMTMSGAGTFDLQCEISGEGIPAGLSQCWTVTVVEGGTVEVSTVEELRSALYSVQAGHPLEIRVAAGTYYIGDPLRIWSGTSLILDDAAEMVFTGAGGDPFLRGSHFDEDGYRCYETSGSCPHGGYGQCHDVVVRGGTWNRNSPKSINSNVFIFRHASGIELSDMTVMKCSNHYFNLSGSEDVLVSNVVFSSAVKYTGADEDFWGKFAQGDADRYKTIEAIHLDALTKGGEPNVLPRDGTPCRNVLVVDCAFTGVFAGVGTHHVARDAVPAAGRAEGIEVRNCTFENLQSFAVYCFGYEDAVIAGNDVTGGAGLLIVEDSTCTATGNAATGGNHNTIQVGNGSTATLSGNVLANAGMAAIRVLGGSTATAKNNTITRPATMGLSAAEGSVLKASGNTVSAAGQHGVYVNAATATLTGNTIKSPVQAGIRADVGAKVTATSNTISGAGTYGITAGGKSAVTAKSNTIASPKNYGIILDSCGTCSVAGNKITSAGSVGIRINNTKGVVVSKNTVNKTAKLCDGILLENCATGTVSGNKVTGAGGFGIRVVGTKKIPVKVAVSGNTAATAAAKSGYHDIRLGDWCQGCSVSGNSLVNGLYSVSKTGTTGNKYAPAGTSLASAVRTANATMAVKWKKQGYAAGYQIQYADNRKFSKAKTITVSKASATSKAIAGLAKKNRYWVRVRTFDKVTGAAAYSAWTPALAALPSWAMGTFSGYAVVKGVPGTVEMSVANSGAVSGTYTVNGVSSDFSVADLTAWDGKKFKVKFAVKIGEKTWKPTYTIAPATGAQTIGRASINVANFVSEMSQSLSLLSPSGKLSALVGKLKTFKASAADAGLADDDSLTLKFVSPDTIEWSGNIGGADVSGRAPCVMRSAAASGTSVVYAAKIPVCIPSAGYARLVTCKVTRKKSGACSVKWAFAEF